MLDDLIALLPTSKATWLLIVTGVAWLLLRCRPLHSISWGTRSLAPFSQPVRGCLARSGFWCGTGDNRSMVNAQFLTAGGVTPASVLSLVSFTPAPTIAKPTRPTGPHHCLKNSKIQAPATIQATPAARATHRPKGVSFSKRTSSARSAIQSTFITPPTNKSTIRTQQQPTQ